MATIEDYGINKRESLSPEVAKFLINAPDDEWLQNFGKNFQEIDKEQIPPRLAPAYIGKFIAIHDLVVLAPFSNNLYHATMLEAAKLLDRDLVREKQDEMRSLGTGLVSRNPHDTDKISDGGYFRLRSDNGVVNEIELSRESAQFGRADEEGRLQTVEYTQKMLKNITATAFKELDLEDLIASFQSRNK